MQGHASSQVPMGLSRRASMAYGRAASGSHLCTHDSSGGSGLSGGPSEEDDDDDEVVEKGEKLVGRRGLPRSRSDAERGCGYPRRVMRWRRRASEQGSVHLEEGAW
jgi:hypothetical protein